MRRLVALLALTAAWAGLPPTAAGAETSHPVVIVVGAPGLRWSDVGATNTPALARLARDGASGVLAVRTAAPADCPADGWLTLGAGNRVRSAGRHPELCPATFPSPSSLPDQVHANEDRREGADPGLLADTLRSRGHCVAGAGPGARLRAAASDGPEAAPAVTGNVLSLLSPGATSCDVLLLQAAPLGVDGRAAGAAAVDALVDRVDQLRPDGSTLLVVGLSEGPGERDPHLHVAIASGPRFDDGALISASTRRAPYVQLVDVAPTILSLLGIATPDAMIGEPWRSTGDVPSRGLLLDQERKSDAQRDVTVPFFVVLVGIQLLLVGIALLIRRWR